jgi:POT family proton-dependent oligopeptide transporter
MSNQYRTAPVRSAALPTGIPYIVGNEAAERFSYYGMRAILVVFMTQHLLDSEGAHATMSDAEARSFYHLFSFAVYFFPLVGALVSDLLWGKYRTILILSIVYCLGHLALALDDTRLGLSVGLGLIAIGSGGIKPCVSAHVGDQFGATNGRLVGRVFGWFYLAINFGAFVSSISTPLLLERFGANVAFGLPGALMFIATWVFWLGRREFVHIPAAGFDSVRVALGGEGGRAILRLLPIYVFFAAFWALYDQTGSSWVLQAQRMDRQLFGIEWLPSQIQAINPILILILVPLFSAVIYPAVERRVELTPLRKIGVGLFLMVGAFLVPAWIEYRIGAGEVPSIAWQLVAYLVLTASEVLVSVTGLEFSYTQAPAELKSIVMSLFLLAISAGNLLTSGVNFVLARMGPEMLAGAGYYLFFAAIMALASMFFVVAASRYQGSVQLQKEA